MADADQGQFPHIKDDEDLPLFAGITEFSFCRRSRSSPSLYLESDACLSLLLLFPRSPATAPCRAASSLRSLSTLLSFFSFAPLRRLREALPRADCCPCSRPAFAAVSGGAGLRSFASWLLQRRRSQPPLPWAGCQGCLLTASRGSAHQALSPGRLGRSDCLLVDRRIACGPGPRGSALCA